MVTGKLPILHGICVGRLDVTTMRSTHTAYLPLPQISLSSLRVHILPVIKYFCLVYVGQLCDDGFAVKFNTNYVFLKKVNYILTSYIDATMGLYLIYFDNNQYLLVVLNHALLPPPTPPPIPSNTLANSIHKVSTKR